MRERLEQRLSELGSEFETGRKMLEEMEIKQAEIQKTLLRISGAMQVIQELLEGEAEPGPDGVGQLVGTTDGFSPADEGR